MSNLDVGTQIPVPSSQPIGTDARGNPIFISQPWYRFFMNLFTRTGGSGGEASIILDTISDQRGSLLGRFASAWQGFSAASGEFNRIPALGFNLDPDLKSLSELIDDAISNTEGSLLYRGPLSWNALPPGSNGEFLSLALGLPDWVTRPTAFSALGSAVTTAAATSTILNLAPSNMMIVAFWFISHSGGGAENLQIALSDDNGASFGTPVVITPAAIAAAASINGNINIFNTNSVGNGKIIVPGGLSVAGGLELAELGVTNALRISWSGGASFDGGAWAAYGIN